MSETSNTPSVPDAGTYSEPRKCSCGASFIRRLSYWKHRLVCEENR